VIIRLSRPSQLLLLGTILPALTFARWIYKGEFGSDFAVFWRAGSLFLAGDWAAIYRTVAEYNFPYPPHALLLFTPFAILSFWPALVAWNLLSAAFFIWAARPYGQIAILTPGALMCLYYGQTGLIVGGLWLLAFRGKWPAVALLTIKPHLGFLSVLSLQSLRQAAMVAGIAIALALPLISLWPDFVAHSLAHTTDMAQENYHWHFVAVTPAIAYGVIGWIPFALAAALMLARNVNVFTAATAALLIAPYGFSYDMPVACLGIFLAARRHWEQLSTLDRLALALGFLCPSIARFGVWWVPPLLLWCLWVQVKLPSPAAGEPFSVNMK
jgi:hypothetical protein